MSVYVDSMRAPVGRLLLCHMLADTSAELLAMADLIGVDRQWLQQAGTPREHFDIAQTKRAAAIRAGALEVTWRQLAAVLRAKRSARGPRTA